MILNNNMDDFPLELACINSTQCVISPSFIKSPISLSTLLIQSSRTTRKGPTDGARVCQSPPLFA